MNKFLSIALATFVFAFAASTVSAAGESQCQPIYGGGEICREQVKFTVDKLVQKSNTKGGNGEYVQNLTINDVRYQPGQNVNFKIVVENTGDTTISNINLTDRFPEFLTFVAGVGSGAEGAREITFSIGELAPGEKKEFTLTAKTADTDVLPNNKSITCVTNNVKAVSNDGMTAEDNSQVCIEKGITAKPTPGVSEKPTVTIEEKPVIEKIPATGPEMVIFGLVPAGLAGLYLRRKIS